MSQQVSAADTPARDRKPDPSEESAKASILVVDDDPRGLRAMQQLLAAGDRRIVAAGSG